MIGNADDQKLGDVVSLCAAETWQIPLQSSAATYSGPFLWRALKYLTLLNTPRHTEANSHTHTCMSDKNCLETKQPK